MFQQVELKGQGYGRMLWDAFRRRPRFEIAFRSCLIHAVGFYTAMGAELERLHEVAPRFSLGVFWYGLH